MSTNRSLHFSLGPAFYYMIFASDIENFITVEAEGKNPHVMSHQELSPIIEKYIYSHNQGVDESKIDKYIKCICEHTSPSLRN